jgi:hypothetical protein
MRKSEACPSKYFRAKDCPEDWVLNAEIELARMEKFEGGRGKDGGEKMVCYFRRQKSGLVIGPVLWDALIELTGEEDSDNWPGHRVQLYRDVTQFGRETVPCIRVRAAPESSAKKPVKKPVAVDEDEEAFA